MLWYQRSCTLCLYSLSQSHIHFFKTDLFHRCFFFCPLKGKAYLQVKKISILFFIRFQSWPNQFTKVSVYYPIVLLFFQLNSVLSQTCKREIGNEQLPYRYCCSCIAVTTISNNQKLLILKLPLSDLILNQIRLIYKGKSIFDQIFNCLFLKKQHQDEH